MLISGAQRLPNGNTLVCSGINGVVFEVTPEKEMVWKYANPVMGHPGRPRRVSQADRAAGFLHPRHDRT